MPKVKDGYFVDKKNSILDTAEKILKTKPLYKLTMKDIIKETGLSPGAVYASFSDIDDVIIALVNRLSVSTDFVDDTNKILNAANIPEESIKELFRYFMELINKTVTSYGKIHYELSTVITDSNRRQKIIKGIDEIQTYSYTLNHIIRIIEENINNGYFKPVLSKESIYALIFAFFDGLVRDLTLLKCYNYEGTPQSVTFEEKDLPEALIASVIHILNHVEK